jgi:hypothetical protein
MPIFKYFLWAGPWVSLLLFGWSEYLEPAGSRAQGVPQPPKTVEVFRPTPAPPIVESGPPLPLQSSPSAEIEKSMKPSKIARVHPHKVKTKVARVPREREMPRDSFAFTPTHPFTPAQPFFLSWR